MKTIYMGLLVGLLSITINAQEVSLEWAKTFGGSAGDHSYSVLPDEFGNIYTIGVFSDIVDFDPGLAVFNLDSEGGQFYIQKLNTEGDFLWAKNFAGGLYDIGSYGSLDEMGNIYLTGIFQDTVDVDPGPGVFNLISNGMSDVFIVKLDSNGYFLWARSVGGIGFDYGYAILTEPTGDSYIVGEFQGSVDFDPSISNYELISNGDSDVFVLKLNSEGEWIWAKSFGGLFQERGRSIVSDNSGNLFISGDFWSTQVDFDPGSENYILESSGLNDIFILKLDTDGNFVFARSMGGEMNDFLASITYDQLENLYSTGYFFGTADFDPSLNDTFNLVANDLPEVFIQKVDTNGELIWAKSLVGLSLDIGASITTDELGNVFITGVFMETVDFDPGPDIFNLTSNGAWDIFFLWLDPDGTFMNAYSMGDFENDFGVSITTDLSGNIFLTGYFQNTVDVDPSTNELNYTSNGLADVFIQKLNINPSSLLESEKSDRVFIYPNPSSDLLQVMIPEGITDGTWEIVDIQGKLLASAAFNVFDQRTQIDLQDLAKGSYTLRIISSAVVLTAAFVKQ